MLSRELLRCPVSARFLACAGVSVRTSVDLAVPRLVYGLGPVTLVYASDHGEHFFSDDADSIEAQYGSRRYAQKRQLHGPGLERLMCMVSEFGQPPA